MRRYFCVLLLSFLCLSLSAQKDSLSFKEQFPRHELQFGLGDPLLASQSFDLYWIHHPFNYSNNGWFSDDNYTKYTFLTPAITVSYFYRIKKWLWVGGHVSYASGYAWLHDKITDNRIGTNHSHNISVAPVVRFSWLNKKYVTLYSAVGFSLSCDISRRNDKYRSISMGTHIMPQLTFVGVSVGKRWFGFSELGMGDKGIFSAGFGYRFNSK